MPFMSPDLVQDDSGTWQHVIGKLWWLKVPR
jgi:hypothetical protein